ncbi:hypothetical protein D9M68_874700 [compost metagenome]
MYKPNREFQATSSDAIEPGSPTSVPMLVSHCPGPVNKSASSEAPPPGGLKSIQPKLPVP